MTTMNIKYRKGLKIFLFFIVLLLSQCTSENIVLKLYDTNTIDAKKVAEIEISPQLRLYQIDKIKISEQPANILLPPGKHEFYVYLNIISNISYDRMFGGILMSSSAITGDSLMISFESSEGGKYIISPFFEDKRKHSGRYGIVVKDKSYSPPLIIEPAKLPNWASLDIQIEEMESSRKNIEENIKLLNTREERIIAGMEISKIYDTYPEYKASLDDVIEKKVTEIIPKLSIKDLLKLAEKKEYYPSSEITFRKPHRTDFSIRLVDDITNELKKRGSEAVSEFCSQVSASRNPISRNIIEIIRRLNSKDLKSIKSKLLADKLLQENSLDIKTRIVNELTKIGDSISINALKSFQKTTTPDLSWNILLGLGELDDSLSVQILIDSVLYSSSSDRKGEAARAIRDSKRISLLTERLGKEYKSYIELLIDIKLDHWKTLCEKIDQAKPLLKEFIEKKDENSAEFATILSMLNDPFGDKYMDFYMCASGKKNYKSVIFYTLYDITNLNNKIKFYHYLLGNLFGKIKKELSEDEINMYLEEAKKYKCDWIVEKCTKLITLIDN